MNRPEWQLWHLLRNPPVAKVIPPPEVAARPATDDETPGSAALLYREAVANGWYGSVTYARGPVLHSGHGTFLRMADSICVRLARPIGRGGHPHDLQRVVAGWIDGANTGAVAWSAGQAARELSWSDVKAHVRTPIGNVNTERNAA